MNGNETGDHMKALFTWWPLLAAVVAGAMAWGTLSRQVDEFDRRLTNMETFRTSLDDLRLQLVRIESRTERMAETLAELREDRRPRPPGGPL